jgi:hypothetical protein
MAVIIGVTVAGPSSASRVHNFASLLLAVHRRHPRVRLRGRAPACAMWTSSDSSERSTPRRLRLLNNKAECLGQYTEWSACAGSCATSSPLWNAVGFLPAGPNPLPNPNRRLDIPVREEQHLGPDHFEHFAASGCGSKLFSRRDLAARWTSLRTSSINSSSTDRGTHLSSSRLQISTKSASRPVSSR